MTKRVICFMCKACNGTGKSPWYEGRDCDQCDGKGTVPSYLALSK